MNASESSFSADAGAAAFDEVDISSLVALSPHRPPDYEAENRALAALAELARISGVGESKLAKYGESILELLGEP